MAKDKKKIVSVGSMGLKITAFCMILVFCMGFGIGNSMSKSIFKSLYGEETEETEEAEELEESNEQEASVENEDSNKQENTIEDENTAVKEEENITESEEILSGNGKEIVYFSQEDERWANEYYGNNDDMSTYGCGPSVLAMLVSSFTENRVTPIEMAKWAYDNGYYSSGSGSLHSIIPEGSKSFGLKVTNLGKSNKYEIQDCLDQGKVVVGLMGKGYFTEGGHFIILRGVSNQGQILIADSKNKENNEKGFNIELILNESKKNATFGGPFWAIEKMNNRI